jgi:GTPase Era involved in 16S rRNA processing
MKKVLALVLALAMLFCIVGCASKEEKAANKWLKEYEELIEDFKDEDTLIRINANIYCEKESHKGIIVGKGGAELKMVGTYARQDMEKLFGTKVYLNLWVKVKANWRESEQVVSNFGYNRDEE